MTIRVKQSLLALLLFVIMLSIIPLTASAASKSVTVGSLVVTTTHEEGLIEDVDYSIEDRTYDRLVLTTSKSVTIKMKEGKDIAYNSIVINNVGGVTSSNITFSNLNLKSKTNDSVISVWNSEKAPFDVKLTFKGENTLNSNHSTCAAINAGTGNVTVKGGTVITNSNFIAQNDFTFEDITLKFKGSGAGSDYRIQTTRSSDKTKDGNIILDNVNITTGSSTKHVPIISKHGTITIKDSDISRGKNIDAVNGITIENSTLDLGFQGKVGIIRSSNGPVFISDSDVDFETSTSFESDVCRGIAAIKDTVTIQRSTISTKAYDRSDYGIYGKKVKISSSIVNIDGYNTGLKAKTDGISITCSEIDIDANKKAILIGPQKDGTISLSKLSLSGSKLNNGAKKGRYSTSSGSYLTIKTSSGKNATDVKISMTKPARPVITCSNVEKTGKIKLTWNKNPLADKYEVWRATSKSGKYTLMLTTKSGSYTNTSAVAEKTYYYKVRAITGSKKSSYSTIKSRTCDLAQPIITVSNLETTGEIKISWDKVKYADQYQIWYASSKNGKYALLDKTTACKYTHTSAEPEQTYYYKVRAISKKTENANSAYSAVKKGTAPAIVIEEE